MSNPRTGQLGQELDKPIWVLVSTVESDDVSGSAIKPSKQTTKLCRSCTYIHAQSLNPHPRTARTRSPTPSFPNQAPGPHPATARLQPSKPRHLPTLLPSTTNPDRGFKLSARMRRRVMIVHDKDGHAKKESRKQTRHKNELVETSSPIRWGFISVWSILQGLSGGPVFTEKRT